MNLKLSHSQLNKLKSAIKSRNDVTLNLLSNFIGNSNNENKLLLTDTQVSTIRKTLTNRSSANIIFKNSIV